MRVRFMLAMLAGAAVVCAVPGPVTAAGPETSGTIVTVVVDGKPGTTHAGSEMLAVRTERGLFPLSEGESAPEGARVTGTVDASGQFSIDAVTPPRSAPAQLEPRVQTVTVVQAQWKNEKQIQGDAAATAEVIEEKVAPYWSEMTGGRLQLVVTETLSLSIPVRKPDDCDYYRLLAPVQGVTRIYPDVGEHLVVVTEQEDCSWAGVGTRPASVTEAGGWIVLNGHGRDARVIAHEFGHNFSLKHAASQYCYGPNGDGVPDSEQCTISEYGDYFDVMGGGTFGFGGLSPVSPIMLEQLDSVDLLDPQLDDASSGSALHEIYARNSGAGTRALKVVDGNNVYWLEYRPQRYTADGEPWCGDGVLVRRVEQESVRYASRLMNPVGTMGLLPGSGITLASGDTRLTVVDADQDSAQVEVDRDFADAAAADTDPPHPFEITLRSHVTPDGQPYDDQGDSRLTWTSVGDNGTGIAYYEVLRDGVLDGTISAQTCGEFSTGIYAPDGIHRYAIRATDLAGNTTTSNEVALLGDETPPVFSQDVTATMRQGDVKRLNRDLERYSVPVTLNWAVDENPGGVGLIPQGQFIRGPHYDGRSIDVTTGTTQVTYRRLSYQGRSNALSIEARDLVENRARSTVRLGGTLVLERRFTTSPAWARQQSASAIGGTRITAERSGSQVSVTLGEGMYGVVARTGPQQGAITISVDGTAVETIDLATARVHPRRIVWTTPASGVPGTTLEITTATGDPVSLDDLVRLRPY